MLSGIPQGAVLHQSNPLCRVHNSYMSDTLTSLLMMFADDAKVSRQIETRADTATLNDLDHLTDWSRKWQMNFNVNT